MEYLTRYTLSSLELDIIKKARQYFLAMIENNPDEEFWVDRFGLRDHLEQLQKWAAFALDNHDGMDPFIVFLSIWFHDIGHYPVNEEDHAIKWAFLTQKILEDEWIDPDIIQKVVHCVRSHRNRDVFPETLEAQMIACIDSASHFTDPLMYMSILSVGKFDYLEGKIERDYRDIQWFPKILNKITPFYEAYKKLIAEHRQFTF